MLTLDLTQLSWSLVGWYPHTWTWLAAGNPEWYQRDLRRHQCTPIIPAQLPGSVQDDLRRAGLLPDWNVGLNAPLCEWVEHRHWEYRCDLPVPADWAGRRIILRAEGLDYIGYVLIDGVVVGSFRGMLTPHEFDLTAALRPGETQRLSILFEEPPAEQGQIGYTSRSRYFKARYAYMWDWSPRLVPIGIWDRLTLIAAGPTRLHGCLPHARYDADKGEGSLSFRLDVETPATARLLCRVQIHAGDRLLYEEALPCVFASGRTETTLLLSRPLDVQPWWPNGLGDHKLYGLTVQLETLMGEVLDQWQGRVGFRQVRWLPCEGAPANAEPWIAEVNGRRIFLQGVNWVPVRVTYGSVTREMYAERLKLYAEMGLNILRVWGGAILEKKEFYDLCDELGLFVWQEFPLSSSGVENAPPQEPEVLAELRGIVASYIWRRGGHAAHLLWAGGNELTRGDMVPINEINPAVALMAGVAAHLDPGKRFVSSSPSGPSFSFDPATVDQGLHHDTHGPWTIEGSLAAWRAHWDRHDALLVSEVGAPGCSPVEIIRRYVGELDPWPPSAENPLWLYRQPWWIQWEHLAERHGFAAEREELERFVRASQEEQAEALAYMAASCKKRFPRCGGVMIWMGHDCYPCLSNTAVVDFDGRPKPAAEALKSVFRENQPQPTSL